MYISFAGRHISFGIIYFYSLRHFYLQQNELYYLQYNNDEICTLASQVVIFHSQVVGHHTIHYTIFYLHLNELYYLQYNNDKYIYTLASQVVIFHLQGTILFITPFYTYNRMNNINYSTIMMIIYTLASQVVYFGGGIIYFQLQNNFIQLQYELLIFHLLQGTILCSLRHFLLKTK